MIQVFVSRQVVERNDETGSCEPVFTIVGPDNAEYYGTEVIYTGIAVSKYDRNKPVGRRIWIETSEKVIVLNGNDITSVFPTVVDFRE